MRTLVRLTFRQHQFELVALGALLVLITVGLLAVIATWSTLPIAECLALTELTARCYQAQEAIQSMGVVVMPLMIAAVVGPAAAGVILGAGLVSKEIERGTAVLPWTLGRSRRRWLLERMLVIMVFVGAMGLVLAVLTDSISLLFDQTPLDRSLYAYPFRGWMVPARGMVGLAAGVLAGAMVGRAVPALLAGAMIAALCSLGVYNVGSELNRAQAVEDDGPGGLVVASIVRDHTGAIVSEEEAWNRFSMDDPDWAQKFEAEFTWHDVGVPGSESRIVTGREVLMLGGVAVLMTAGAVVVVERRRPY
jgi:ABC-type transport system involved in multi-copper enzyme maturation permease subunit